MISRPDVVADVIQTAAVAVTATAGPAWALGM
jgi:hypothetical protein